MEQLHIALITAYYPPDRIAGAELGTQIIARDLAARGHRVSVLITRPANRRGRRERENENLTIYRLPFLNIRFLRFFSEVFFALWALVRLRPDVVHGQCLLPACFVSGLWTRMSGTPSVGYVYGHDVASATGGFRARIGSRAFRWCTEVYAATKWTGDLAEKISSGSSLKVRYSGFHTDRFSAEGPTEDLGNAEELKILFVGRMIPEKGLEHLIRAVSRLAEQGRQPQLTAIGKGHLTSELRQLGDQLGVGDQVTWIEFVDNADLALYIRGCDVFVLPSLAEPFGLVALEAMACGKPVITTNSGGVAEVVRNGMDGLVVEPGSTEQLVLALTRLAQDPDERARMGRNGIERAAEFDWKSRLNEWMETYARLTS